jgi:hypothetical protein
MAAGTTAMIAFRLGRSAAADGQLPLRHLELESSCSIPKLVSRVHVVGRLRVVSAAKPEHERVHPEAVAVGQQR